MTSDDFVADAAEGVARVVISCTTEKVKNLVRRFRDRKLAFIQERETIDNVKEQLKTNENSFYENYIEDEEMRYCLAMGLTLRKLDSEGQLKRREDLCKRISDKFGLKGLHISYLVQNGVLSRYLTSLMEEIKDLNVLKRKIRDFLDEIDKFSYFIRAGQEVKQVSDTIKTKLNANTPEVFILSGMGSAAQIILSSFEAIQEDVCAEYDFERYSGKKREILLLTKKIEF